MEIQQSHNLNGDYSVEGNSLRLISVSLVDDLKKQTKAKKHNLYMRFGALL